MQRSARKNQRLQERLSAIQNELSRVEGDIRTVSKAVEDPDREKALRRLKQFSAEAEREAAVESRVVPAAETPAGRADFFEKAATPVGGMAGDHGDGRDAFVSKPPPDQRFAQYFVTGGLHSVRPLRQERREQRNRAIIMAVIAAFVLYGVISMLF
jgi:hypothetical protein